MKMNGILKMYRQIECEVLRLYYSRKKPKDLKLISYPNPVLECKCDPVKQVGDYELAVAKRLKEIMLSYNGIKSKWIGVGMSAPQIGISKQICVINPTKPSTLINERKEKKKRDRLTYFVFNPAIVSHGKQFDIGKEGCLSDQSAHIDKKRWQIIEVVYMDEQGHIIQAKLSGWEAKVMQHEISHLNGRLCRDL